MTCIVVFSAGCFSDFNIPTISQSLEKCNTMIMMKIIFLIIVPFVAFRLRERKESFCLFVFWLFFPLFSPFFNFLIFFIFVAYTTFNDSVTNSAPKPTYLGLRSRLMFQICMHCLHFSGIWMLVPCSRNSTLISKIFMGLVKTQDMTMYKIYWPFSFTCSSIVLCVHVCQAAT